jgi:hypothetical protein
MDRMRADAASEREELRELLEDRARMLAEARDEQRARAERAERDLDAARGELAQVRQESGTAAAERTEAAPGRPGAARGRLADPDQVEDPDQLGVVVDV